MTDHIDDRPRCPWAEPGPRPDLLMTRYHDDEWGLPVHGDAELFERLALTDHRRAIVVDHPAEAAGLPRGPA
jgi:hypothetical protein